MKFKVGETTVTLHGDPTLERAKISLKAMIKTIRREGHGILVELTQHERNEPGGFPLTGG